MPATPRTPLWPWALPLAGLFRLVPFAAKADDGPHLPPHGIETLWLALTAALPVGAGCAVARKHR